MTGGNPPRRKGHNFEREIVRIALKHGYKAVRTPSSKYPDVRLNDRPISCKRRKAGYGWIYKELENHDYILCRDDGKPIIKMSFWKP